MKFVPQGSSLEGNDPNRIVFFWHSPIRRTFRKVFTLRAKWSIAIRIHTIGAKRFGAQSFESFALWKALTHLAFSLHQTLPMAFVRSADHSDITDKPAANNVRNCCELAAPHRGRQTLPQRPQNIVLLRCSEIGEAQLSSLFVASRPRRISLETPLQTMPSSAHSLTTSFKQAFVSPHTAASAWIDEHLILLLCGRTLS